MGSIITGTGIAVPDRVVTNADLEQIMDTSDEWIRTRSGVEQRHIAEPGVGSSQLGAEAVTRALADAGVEPADVDLLVSATMTPDHFAPGNAPLIQDKAGLGSVAAYEIRQQCGGFLYGLDLADAMLTTGRATTAVVVGAEVHSGYMPYGASFDILRGTSTAAPTDHDFAEATAARGWAVLFGDGAGACVMRHDERPEVGFLTTDLHSDGSNFDLIHVPGLGFVNQPYIDAAQLEAKQHWPQMNGMELFRQAVRSMPASVRTVLDRCDMTVDDVELIVAHQANDRILEGIRKQLGVDADKLPSNIATYGNTTAGTLPILFHERRSALSSGDVVCFTAFGAGAHWGAALYRTP